MMRYFKNNKNRQVYAIPVQQEYLIHIDWIEITQIEYESFNGEHIENTLFNTVKNAPELTSQRLREINDRLLEIDIESIRPLRSIACNLDNLLDHQKLKALNEERQVLLSEMRNSKG
ncbi:MAG: hypothetical protein R3254_03620 [Thiomicrorhabdus sp.]|nr:hypothetical protein [Thiomicrorhabdus sp.]